MIGPERGDKLTEFCSNWSMLCFFGFGLLRQTPVGRCPFIGEDPARWLFGWIMILQQRLHMTFGSPVFSCATCSKLCQTSDFFFPSQRIEVCISGLDPRSCSQPPIHKLISGIVHLRVGMKEDPETLKVRANAWRLDRGTYWLWGKTEFRD